MIALQVEELLGNPANLGVQAVHVRGRPFARANVLQAGDAVNGQRRVAAGQLPRHDLYISGNVSGCREMLLRFAHSLPDVPEARACCGPGMQCVLQLHMVLDLHESKR
jgi:hypothetical protein